ncbi:MAG: hypothetical protein ACD_75C00259G0003 [uncultured bacterium]|nr:MAG: hypothetical protein ACD_75C00259G0003 [uncultured bacterium]HBG21212.1 hypothetical protein [Desulfobulbaceae bacterium]
MDSSLGFAVFVLAMCVLHLVWTASVRWLRHVSPLQKTAAREKGRAPRRSDWYVFFHCADLVGKDPVEKKSSADIPSRTVTERKNYRLTRVNPS